MNIEIKNPSEWALETKTNIPVHTDSGDVNLPIGTLFAYDINQNLFVHIFGKEIPELEGVEAKVFGYRTNELFSSYDEWLDKNFKKVSCPPELQITKKQTPYKDWLNSFNFRNEIFRNYGEWPTSVGEGGRKLFKFGEVAIFIQDFPEERVTPLKKLRENKSNSYTFTTGKAKYNMGEEYPTLGSTELKVLLIDSEGKLDLIPFFAVQNTGRIAHWFKFKWWLKIYLESKGLAKSYVRFDSIFSHYADDKKVDSSVTKGFYVGERLKIVKPFPPKGLGGTYEIGEIYPTLGIYHSKKEVPFISNILSRSETNDTQPKALILNNLGQFDFIPLDYVTRIDKYDIFFIIEYYCKILLYKIKEKYGHRSTI